MRKVLITGATGFVGSHITKRLVALDYEVHAVIRKTSNIVGLQDIEDKIKIYTYDGTLISMMEILERSKPDIVIHLTAFFVAEHSSDDIDSLFLSNILFGSHLLEAMYKAKVSYMINTGTHWQHYNNEEFNPVDLYAATKKAFEDIGKYYTQATSLRMITLKLFDTYGPNDNRPKIFSLFNKIAQTGELLKMSAGEQIMGLVYIDDVVDAFICAMDEIFHKPEHYQEDFFIFPDEIYTLKEVASTYEKVLGTKLNIQWGAREYRFREIIKPFMGKKLYGWTANTDLSKGIALMLKK